MDKLEQVKKEIERRRDIFRTSVASIDGCKANVLTDILYFIDSLQEEPAEIDFEHELYKAFGQVKDFTLGMRIAKWFYNMGKNSREPVSKDFEMALAEMIDNAQKNVIEPWVVAAQWKDELIELVKSEEPVSENLKKAAVEAFKKIVDSDKNSFLEIFKAGAKWQKEKDMASLPAKAL